MITDYIIFVNNMLTALLFIAILSLLVIVHELGHFITARLSGMRVYEFGMGFPPRAFGVYLDPVTKKLVWIIRKRNKETGKLENSETNLVNTVGGGEKDEEFPATLYSFNWLPLGGSAGSA